MRKIRSLKPGWIDDEKLCQCTPAARVLSAALLLLADDYGRGRANPVFLRSQVFRYTRGINVKKLLQELITIQYLTIYRCRDEDYYEIRTWSKHQYIKKPAKSSIPENFYGSSTLLDREGNKEGRGNCVADAPPPSPVVPLAQEAANELPPTVVCSKQPQPLRNGVAQEAAKSIEDRALEAERYYLEKMNSRGDRAFMSRVSEKEIQSLRKICERTPEVLPAIDLFLVCQNKWYKQREWNISCLEEDLGQFLKRIPVKTVAATPQYALAPDTTDEECEALGVFEESYKSEHEKEKFLRENKCLDPVTYLGKWGSRANLTVLEWYRNRRDEPKTAKKLDKEVVMEQVRAIIGNEITW
jgi:hypothetical protein